MVYRTSKYKKLKSEVEKQSKKCMQRFVGVFDSLLMLLLTFNICYMISGLRFILVSFARNKKADWEKSKVSSYLCIYSSNLYSMTLHYIYEEVINIQ